MTQLCLTPRLHGCAQNDSAEDRTFLLILERPDAVSLEEALVQGWRPTEAEVVSLAEGVLEILDFLAQLRPPVSHSTLSPARIHIGAPGSAQGGARSVPAPRAQHPHCLRS